MVGRDDLADRRGNDEQFVFAGAPVETIVSVGDVDRLFGVDWSGAARDGDSAIFVAEGRCYANRVEAVTLTRARSRGAVEAFLRGGQPLQRHVRWEPSDGAIERWPAPAPIDPDENVLVGLDFAFGFPRAFVDALSPEEPWAWCDRADRHDSLDDFIRAVGWFKFSADDELPGQENALRETERVTQASPSSVFDLTGPWQVGRGSIRGMAMLHRLGDEVHVWPFNNVDRNTGNRPVLVEMYPAMWLQDTAKSHLPVRVAQLDFLGQWVDFDENVRLAVAGDADGLDALAILSAFVRIDRDVELGRPLPQAAATEGWIWGVPTDPRPRVLEQHPDR